VISVTNHQWGRSPGIPGEAGPADESFTLYDHVSLWMEVSYEQRNLEKELREHE
jgi:hypothetical protein